MTNIDEVAWELLHQALDLYRTDPVVGDELNRHLTRFTQPLRIAVAGPQGSGKSTLINALMGEEIAPVSSEVFAWYLDGPEPAVTAHYAEGLTRDLPVTRSAAGLRLAPGALPDDVEEIVVRWPTRAMRNASLLDTLAGSDMDRVLREADAILYLSPDTRAAGLRAWQDTHDTPVTRAAPVNLMVLLSRADEIGGGRIDALVTAKQLARQRPQDTFSSIGVQAFSGLIALASRMVTEPDFAALAMMAGAPRESLDLALLSTDRFVGPGFPVLLGIEARQALLARFGIHGVRLAMTLIRTGCDNRVKLAAELARRSGLTELRESLNHQFVERRAVLKARSVLVAVEGVLRKDTGHHADRTVDELRAQVERALASAHEFRELRLLAALRAAGFEPDLGAEAHRLIGGNGSHLAARLGVDEGTHPGELWQLTSDALWRWQNHAEDVELSLSQRRAARVVVRSCEGLLASLS